MVEEDAAEEEPLSKRPKRGVTSSGAAPNPPPAVEQAKRGGRGKAAEYITHITHM